MIKQLLIVLATVFFPFNVEAQDGIGEVITTMQIPNSYAISVMVDEQGEKFMRYDGEFGHLTDYNIGVFLDQYRDIKYIVFNSSGGNLIEANSVGKRIRERDIRVWVPRGHMCMSACAYLSLFSKDIDIDGVMGFHLPYSPGYPRDASLYEISQSTVERTLRVSRDFFNNGFKLYLYLKISEHSSADIDTWLAFTDEAELNKFRFDDPSEFMDSVAGAVYATGSTEAMMQLVNEQMISGVINGQ